MRKRLYVVQSNSVLASGRRSTYTVMLVHSSCVKWLEVKAWYYKYHASNQIYRLGGKLTNEFKEIAIKENLKCVYDEGNRKYRLAKYED